MACIDKIYGTSDQWLELTDWLKKHYPYGLGRMYSIPPDDGQQYALSNFDVGTDIHLKDHCDISFVRARLREQGYEISDHPKKLIIQKKRCHGNRFK